jgi:RimJ/RimL family protein N-acetyltransferase
MLEWAREQGNIRKVEAAFLGWNEPVIAFLGKMGFTEEGRAKGSWMVVDAEGGTEYDDIVHMGLWLDD